MGGDIEGLSGHCERKPKIDDKVTQVNNISLI
jgi:hypothetical protein